MAEDTKKEEAVAEAPATTTEAPAPAANPEDDGAGGLSVGDLKSIQGIIEVATNRGAFKAAELSAVGTIFDKLSKFLTSLDEQMAAQKEAETSEEKK